MNNQKNIWTIFISVIAAALIVGGGVYAWQKSNTKSNEPTAKTDNTVTTATNGNINEKEIPQGLSSLDTTWNLYTNNKYGFSIKVPKKMYHGFGSMCEWLRDSYRPKSGFVPVKVFENENVYISSEYFYKLTGQTTRNNINYYAGCEKVTNTIARLDDTANFQQQSWKLVIKNVSNDSQLEAFIKERYGSGCKLGSKNASAQEGVYNVSIQGDGRDMDTTECPLNYITVLKYYPAKNKAISWNLGQAPTFAGDESYQIIYDQEMVNSFRFK